MLTGYSFRKVKLARFALGYILLVFFAGCVTSEGVSFSKPTFCLDSDKEAEAPASANSAVLAKNAIVIGRVTVFRAFTADNVAKGYREYSKCAGDTVPHLSAVDFSQGIAGWTGIQVANWGFAGRTGRTLVPTRLAGRLNYTNAFLSSFGGRAMDLVASHGNEDGVLVIEEVLCGMENGRDSYLECAEQFELGVFDRLTGRQLTYKGFLKKNGILLDTETYRPIP